MSRKPIVPGGVLRLSIQSVLQASILLASCFTSVPLKCSAQDIDHTNAAVTGKPVSPAQHPVDLDGKDLAPRPMATAVSINGRLYRRPTAKEQFKDYLKDSYGLPALARSSVSAVYSQERGKPEQWGQDWPGFGQRFGTACATAAIDGNVRYGMETLFKEDLRYLPCHGCSRKRKLENALLAEVTARHDIDGHRFFTLTPTVTDMSGPIIANAFWVPQHTAIDGFTGSRLIFATRIGGHLFSEFVLERRHRDPKLPDNVR
jgi:hypothetical protein